MRNSTKDEGADKRLVRTCVAYIVTQGMISVEATGLLDILTMVGMKLSLYLLTPSRMGLKRLFLWAFLTGADKGGSGGCFDVWDALSSFRRTFLISSRWGSDKVRRQRVSKGLGVACVGGATDGPKCSFLDPLNLPLLSEVKRGGDG